MSPQWKAVIPIPRVITSKLFVSISVFILVIPILFLHRDSLEGFSVPYPRPYSHVKTQFVTQGDSNCLPEVTQQLVQKSSNKRATCRKYSPFVTRRVRIATVTAHFGESQEYFRKSLQTHLLHSLVHGTEVKVLCDPIVDNLWNKPAFILQLLMAEMLKPAKKRLEWIQWVDRDTLILDQCRPISSFLPPKTSRIGSWWQHDSSELHLDQQNNTTNLLVNNDMNGLNNGVFLLRVNHWAIELFTAILAFRHYKPDIDLPFTEQSAMEHVIHTPQFKGQTQFIPQHWFNAYEHGGPLLFAERGDDASLQKEFARRGDYLVHFAGHPHKDEAIEEWVTVLDNMEDVWEMGSVQRDVSEQIADFWTDLGYARGEND
ncbi:hypothetical protein BKA66DRAFT_451684 [Pyrenochaeta sp. MPI-SDFR-AT-0127]|nr:hypothetical protein BKA66DRAFT_451684 [Pyrenochaeta sp. MPI-SDFR-AT-0127]